MADTAQVGYASASADGNASNPMRAGRLNDLIISQHQPKYAEAAQRGISYSLPLVATTTGAAAGNLNTAAAAASTQFALWNPATSGVNVILKKLLFGINSGTPPGGPLLHNIFSGAIPTIASIGTAYNNKIGSAYSGNAKFIASAAGSALTGGSALVMLRPSTISFSASAFAAAGGSAHYEDIDGDIVLQPGAGWVPCFASAGTALLNSWGITWIEVAI